MTLMSVVFPAAARADEHHQFAGVHIEINAPQRVNILPAGVVRLFHAAAPDRGLENSCWFSAHCASPFEDDRGFEPEDLHDRQCR